MAHAECQITSSNMIPHFSYSSYHISQASLILYLQFIPVIRIPFYLKLSDQKEIFLNSVPFTSL